MHSGARVLRWARACRRGEADIATSAQERHPEALRPVALERRRAPMVEIRLQYSTSSRYFITSNNLSDVLFLSILKY